MQDMLRAAFRAVILGLAILSVSSGTAQAGGTTDEAVSESTGDPCNPCTIHAVGESELITSMGVVVSTCADEYLSNIYTDGSGEVEWVGTVEAGPGCNVTNCIGPGEGHWPISNAAELGPDVGHMTVRFCLRTVSQDVHCNGEVGIAEGDAHLYQFTLDQPCANGTRRVEAYGEIEDIEFNDIELFTTAR